MLEKKSITANVFNDGIAHFNIKQTKLDEYNTPLRGQYELKEIKKYWFRYLGVTQDDIYLAVADDKRITKKIGIDGRKNIDVKNIVVIGNEQFEIYNTTYHFRRNETMVNLIKI